MAIRQVSVYVENKAGRLCEIIRILRDANITIMAHSLEDEKEYGVFRMIVPVPEKVVELLKFKGFSARLTNVVAVLVSDQPGGFHALLEALAENGIDFTYTYSIGHTKGGKAVNILHPADVEKTEMFLTEKGFDVLSETDLITLYEEEEGSAQ